MASNAGRPPIFNSPEELQESIDNFIKNPPTRKAKMNGVDVDIPVVTISRLCYDLGFASRQSFYDYEDHEEFSYTIKRARLYIESEYEANLTGPNCTGSIFALKCMGWDDKSSGPEMPAIPLDITFGVKDAQGDIQVTKGE